MTIITDKAMHAKPGERDIWLIEDAARGAGRLVGRITPSGGRSFYFRYTTPKGDRVRLPIGTFDSHGDGRATFTVEQARDKARELSGLYRTGAKDLREHFVREAEEARLTEEAARQAEEAARQAEAQAAKAEAEARERRMTVRKLFDRWRATELQPTTRADGKRTGRKDGGTYVSQQFERHVFPSIGAMAAADVRKADLLALVDAQKAKGQMRTAAVLLSDLRQMLAFALDRDLIDADPLASVKKSRVVGAAVERDRTLTPAEIKALAAALPAARMGVRSVAAVWLLLATGARVGELMGTVWADALPQTVKARHARLGALQSLAEEEGVKVGVLDLAAKTWHLPDTKNQRDHTIHLSEFALSHFHKLASLREALKDSDEQSPWVFPARNAARPVCVKSFGKQLSDRQREPSQRMAGRSKATESLCLTGGKWTAHDLRRTTGTLLASLGVSGDVIDECLNHMIESRVRRTYIRDRREAEQARAFDALGAKLSALIGGEAIAANVVSLHAA